MFTVYILELAKREWLKSISYYERTQKGLGIRFTKVVHSNLLLIKSSPLLFKKDKNSLHSVYIKPFPFKVFYEVHESQKVIYVASVFHSRRKPKTPSRKILS